MRRKTLAALVTATFILTVFVFCAMWVTRPESSSYSLQVLEEARNRQKQSLVSVSAPLNTDTYQMTQEERIAAMVAEILSSNDEFIGDVKDVLIDDVEYKMAEIGDEVRSDVLSNANAYADQAASLAVGEAATYSDLAADGAIRDSRVNTIKLIAESEAKTSALIDSKIDDSFENDVKSYVSGEVKAFSASDRAYTDSQTAKVLSSAATKLINDKAFTESVTTSVVSKLGISEDGEYIMEVDRLVDEVLAVALTDPELAKVFESAIYSYYAANSESIFNSHMEELLAYIKSLSEEEIYALLGLDPSVEKVVVERPATVKEEAPVVQSEPTVEPVAQKQESKAAPVVEATKERVSAPVFSAPNTALTNEEIVVERESQRDAEINRILEWLGE